MKKNTNSERHNRAGGGVMDIKIIQVDSRVCVEVNGEQLPDIFSGYKINSSESGEAELSLFIQGKLSVAELSAKILRQKR